MRTLQSNKLIIYLALKSKFIYFDLTNNKTPSLVIVEMSTNVWCVFEASIDGDGYLHWNFVFASSTVKTAEDVISSYTTKIEKGIHYSMSKANYWVHVGNRKDINYDPETMSHISGLGGFVIEYQQIW